MKALIISVLFMAISFLSHAQKKGEYMTAGSPVDKLWESVDGKDGGAPMAGMTQQFFFLLQDGASGSMMAPFEMEDYGFACPSYFTLSMDQKYLYLDINMPCELELPEEELFVEVLYKVNEEGTILTLIVDGEEYKYQEWSTD